MTVPNLFIRVSWSVLILFGYQSALCQSAPVSQIEGYLEVFHPQDTTSTYIGLNAGQNYDPRLPNRFNTFLGTDAGSSNTDGLFNSFFGYEAGKNNISGRLNTFIGFKAGTSNTFGLNNTFVGKSSGLANTFGNFNVFLGHISGARNTTGQCNVFLGNVSGNLNTSGSYNTFVGRFSGRNNRTHSANTYIGFSAGLLNDSGAENVMIGDSTGIDIQGEKNVFIGSNAAAMSSSTTLNNTLFIHNEGGNNPLIYGEFDNRLLRINGVLDIDSAYQFPTTDGSAGQVLVTDGAGQLDWAEGTASGNQTLSLNGNTLAITNGNSVDLGSIQDSVIDADADPTNEIQILSKSGNTISLSNNGGSFTDDVNDADDDPSNEIQNLTLDGDSLSISGGNSIALNNISVLDDQTLSLDNTILSIADGNSVDLAPLDTDPLNELQTISKSGNTITLSNNGGSFVDAVNDADDDPSNEIQNLTLAGDSLSISGGNSISLDNISILDDQTLSLNNSVLSIIDGNSVDLSSLDIDSLNELQTISKSGNTITLSNSGGSFVDDVNDADTDPLNELQTISKTGNTITLSNSGGSFVDAVNDADDDPSNEIQNLTLDGDSLSISGGNSISLDNISILDDQTLSLDNSVLSIIDGNSVDLSSLDIDSLNELQTISKSGNTITLSNNGGSFTDDVNDADTDPSNELQNLSFSNDTIRISGGTALAVSQITPSLKISVIQDADMDTRITTESTTNEDTIRFEIGGYELGKMDGKTFHLEAPGGSLFIGKNAGAMDNGTDNQNIYIGHEASIINRVGTENTLVGIRTAQTTDSGTANSYFGYQAGQYAIGNRNTFLGSHAGQENKGSNNIFIGANAGDMVGGSDQLIIDNGSMLVNLNIPFIHGDFANNKLVTRTRFVPIGGVWDLNYDTGIILDNNGLGGDDINFITNNTSSMHIDNGLVQIHETTHIDHPESANGYDAGLRIENVDGTDAWWNFYTRSFNGELQLYSGVDSLKVGTFNPVSGTYSPVSDRKRKKNIKPIGSVLSDIEQLSVYRYNMKNENNTNRKHIGVIAQEVKEYFPEIVNYSIEDDTHTVEYSTLGIIALQAVKEQQVIIQKLNKLIQLLEGRISAIESNNQE